MSRFYSHERWQRRSASSRKQLQRCLTPSAGLWEYCLRRKPFSLGSPWAVQPCPLAFPIHPPGAIPTTGFWQRRYFHVCEFVNRVYGQRPFEALLVAVNSNGCPSDSVRARSLSTKATILFHFKPKQMRRAGGSLLKIFRTETTSITGTLWWPGPSSQADPTHTYREVDCILPSWSRRTTTTAGIRLFRRWTFSVSRKRHRNSLRRRLRAPAAVTVSNASAQASQYF